MFAVGMSPSGKAAGSGPAIRGFESLHPSQMEFSLNPPLSYMVDLVLMLCNKNLVGQINDYL